MLKSNPKLDRFLSEIMSGEPTPIPPDEEAVETAIWSGEATELTEQTYSFYAAGNAGTPKLIYDGWFVFSVEKAVASPGIIFWQDGDRYFARLLDDEQWQSFLSAAKIKKSFW